MKLLMLGIAFIFSIEAYAQNRSWNQLVVPAGKCGDGNTYSVWVSQGKNTKVAFAFQGGGACWDYDSCFGLVKYADLNRDGQVKETGGFFSLDTKQSPVADSTLVFFPYCTGDVHAGRHTAQYKSKTVYHWGATNIEESIKVILNTYPTLFSNANELVVYGYSAGAIGALVHTKTIELVIGGIPNKSLVLDAPGLHWGKNFWHKFTPNQVRDYSSALSSAGLFFDYNDGMVAEVIPSLCKDLLDWRIGVLQSTRDRVMSVVFGDITMTEHEANVLGPRGIYQLTSNEHDNCAAWVPSSATHTFLSSNKTNQISVGGWTALSFTKELIAGKNLKTVH